MVELKNINMREIFEQYKDKIYRLGLAVTRNIYDAEDVLGETFLKIMRNLPRFRGQSSLSTWIYKIALNEARMKVRRTRQEARKFVDSESEIGGQRRNIFERISSKGYTPDEQAIEDEFKVRIEEILNNMPIKYRLVLVLKEVEGMSGQEVADILGLKTNSVKTRLFRAHKFLQNGLQRYFKDKKEPSVVQAASPEKCGLYIKFIYDYINGLIPSHQKTKFDEHISDCSSCNDFLDTYKKALQISRSLQCQDLPAALHSKIESFL